MTSDVGRDNLSGVDPHGKPEVWAPRLVRVLDRQIELYAELERLSSRQSDLVRGDEPDALLDLLARRQVLVEQVTDLNQQLEPFTREWDRLAERLSPGQRDEIGSRTRRLDELIETITGRDEADRRALESRRESVASEINALSNKRAAVAAYGGRAGGGGSGGASPRFQDREG